MNKFELPEIKISTFITENIITTSGGTQKTSAKSAATTWLTGNDVDENNIFGF